MSKAIAIFWTVVLWGGAAAVAATVWGPVAAVFVGCAFVYVRQWDAAARKEAARQAAIEATINDRTRWTESNLNFIHFAILDMADRLHDLDNGPGGFEVLDERKTPPSDWGGWYEYQARMKRLTEERAARAGAQHTEL